MKGLKVAQCLYFQGRRREWGVGDSLKKWEAIHSQQWGVTHLQSWPLEGWSRKFIGLSPAWYPVSKKKKKKKRKEKKRKGKKGEKDKERKKEIKKERKEGRKEEKERKRKEGRKNEPVLRQVIAVIFWQGCSGALDYVRNPRGLVRTGYWALLPEFLIQNDFFGPETVSHKFPGWLWWWRSKDHMLGSMALKTVFWEHVWYNDTMSKAHFKAG